MTVHIVYINKNNRFLFEDDFSTWSEKSFEPINLSEIFKTYQIKEKLKELLFQKIPTFAKASAEVVQLSVYILTAVCSQIIKDIKTSDLYKSIQTTFSELATKLTDLIVENSNLIILKLKKLNEPPVEPDIIIDKDEEESDFEKTILNKIKESTESFQFPFSDQEKINQFCRLGETKLFAIETENNYLCIPFDQEKKFKAIKVANYYNSYFKISDQESAKLLDILLEVKESGKEEFQLTENDRTINVYVVSEEIAEQKFNVDWNSVGVYRHDAKQIIIKNNSNYLKMYSTLTHEYIHFKDSLLDEKINFTNDHLREVISRLGTYLEKGDIVSLWQIGRILKTKKGYRNKPLDVDNPALVRYLVSILEKKHLVQYLPNDYTRIKIIATLNAFRSSSFYHSNDQELNTNVASLINDILADHEEILLGNISKEELDKIINTYIKEYIEHILSEYKENDKDLEKPENKEELEKLKNDLTLNYEKKVKANFESYVKNITANMDKFQKLKKEKTDETKNDLEQSNTETEQNQNISDGLLRQYISLLIH